MSAEQPEKLKAQHVRRCRELCSDIERFVGAVAAIQALLPPDHEATAKLGILRGEFCTMRAGAWEIISDLGALDITGQTERELADCHVQHVHAKPRPRDARMLAAND